MIAVFAFAAVSCVEDLIDPNTPSVGSADDVQFGLSLNDSETRTIYGAEDKNAFPIYWSQGDRVLVASPQCPEGRNSAEYGVTPVSGQSYAEAMNKTGEFGVQWGSNERADFYSIYPSTNASWQTLSETNVTAKLNIASSQSANLVLMDDGVYHSADMNNVIMYARTADVENGKTVNLKYKPYSTILEFEMTIVPTGTNQTYGSAKVMSMALTAPEGTAISGDFTLTFNGNNTPIVSAIGNNSNTISVVFATQPVLYKDNKTLKAKLALIPDADITNINGWEVEIDVLKGSETQTVPYKMTLNTNATLAPGKIHKIKLPAIAPKAAWQYNTESWITSLYDYKNIYLTEISIPGAWYAGTPSKNGYQATDDIATLWSKGVRAFAVETRTMSGVGGFLNSGQSNPNGVVISGLGSEGKTTSGGWNSLHGDIEGERKAGYRRYRGLADGDGVQLREVIGDIASAVRSDEFGVLVLSYADGGQGGHRYVDYGAWLEMLNVEFDALSDDVKKKIYQKELSKDTTIEDVLGTLIIKVNVDANIAKSGSLKDGSNTYSYSYENNLPALLSYNPFMQQMVNADFTKPYFSTNYWKEWNDDFRVYTDALSNGFTWCFSSANRTQLDTGTDTAIPTYSQRKTALRGMIEHSKEVTSAKAHNVWFYFNAGGTQATSVDSATDAKLFAQAMNSWLYDIIKLKANGGTDTNGVFGVPGAYLESDPSPLGIVMFNQCTGDNATYHGEDIIKEIIEMNNKANLLRATTTIVPDIPNEPVPDQGDEV